MDWTLINENMNNRKCIRFWKQRLGWNIGLYRCWWLYVGDNLRMLVTEFRYWWHLLDVVVWRLCHLILKLSPPHFVSNIRHQYRCSRNIVSTFDQKILWFSRQGETYSSGLYPRKNKIFRKLRKSSNPSILTKTSIQKYLIFKVE